MRKYIIKSTQELSNMNSDAVKKWKRSVKKKNLKFTAIFAPVLEFSDYEKFATFTCESRHYEELKMCLKMFLGQGLHPLSVKSNNLYLVSSEIDKLKNNLIVEIPFDSLKGKRARLVEKPSFFSIQHLMTHEK